MPRGLGGRRAGGCRLPLAARGYYRLAMAQIGSILNHRGFERDKEDFRVHPRVAIFPMPIHTCVDSLFSHYCLQSQSMPA